MLNVRPAATRGTTQFDWLESYHSFSFGHYYDPDHMGFSVQVHGLTLNTGDGLAIDQEPQLLAEGISSAELLLFDVPASPEGSL
ncbi:hypothetical protein BRW62_08810 [Parathermosynechococcus lividus PCC 6715]|uniref:Quercetin 2,3-dioxygenase C-terminal cupin domain-containing protein n=1 Tax=Parathermosynechococcus lividus PCC 6715 TaxID=1917166 RepID=A0A2D2Q2S5_PARLV|nr:hypothetical protein [Thermostichus lividus]ATS18831.1 hypothetical protein BRW62_08810 [Thermostichus lividus PCC 6715]